MPPAQKQGWLVLLLRSIRNTRAEHAAETILDATHESGADTAEALIHFLADAVKDEAIQELGMAVLGRGCWPEH